VFKAVGDLNRYLWHQTGWGFGYVSKEVELGRRTKQRMNEYKVNKRKGGMVGGREREAGRGKEGC
jgi:hypothetical protein